MDKWATDKERRAETAANAAAISEAERYLRGTLEEQCGVDNVFDTKQLQQHFVVNGFMSPPYVSVTRKVDGVKGSLRFSHAPRLYFDFVADYYVDEIYKG